jgi:hypothetical protein
MPAWLKWLGGMLLTGILVPAVLLVAKAWVGDQLSDIPALISSLDGEPTAVCDKFIHISDVTVPDGTVFKPGDSFDKIWRVQNDGTCTWTPEYQIAFHSGEKLGGPDATPLGFTVAPDQTVDLLVHLSAPNAGGTYRGYWMLRNSNGQMFGFGPEAKDPIWVEIKVAEIPPTPPPTQQSVYVPPTATKTNQRCNLFKGMDMSVVWLDAAKGSTQFQFYVKMPGGVPGLEKEVAGQTGEWEYEVKIGDYSTTACYVIQGYKNRLYCDFQMPSGYDATVRPMELYVNECSKPVYEDELCELPGLLGMGGGGGSSGTTGTGGGACSSGLGPSECGAAGGTYHTTFCANPPCPAWCSCP